jgi:uncharacterized protein YndB with AHSA1/START domain
MKFSFKEDIEAPLDFVFEQITDYKSMERAAMRRGADVQRVDDLKDYGPGAAWDAKFTFRGKEREVQIEITEFERPNMVVIGSRAPSLGGKMTVELVSLSPSRTRMVLDTELQPKNLSAKLMVQSLKLARKNIEKRVSQRLAGYAEDLEAKYKRSEAA